MYGETIYDLGDRLDHQIGFKGNYGRKGEKRSERRKASSEQIKKQNQYYKKKRVERKMYYNFRELESTYITLTYRPDERPKDMETFKEDRKRFIEGMRAEYKKAGIPFKWMSRAEIGKRGAAHLHFLINNIPNIDMAVLCRKHWDKGRPRLEVVDDLRSGKLAEYFVKLPGDDVKGQLTWMTEKEQKAITAYSCSRNLEEPPKETKVFRRRTTEKMIRDGIKPTAGYVVDKESVTYGVNPFNGMSYLYYREYRIKTTTESDLVPLPEKEVKPPWEW